MKRKRFGFTILLFLLFLSGSGKAVQAAWSAPTKAVRTSTTQKERKTKLPRKAKRTRKTSKSSTSLVWKTQTSSQKKTRKRTVTRITTVTAYRKGSRIKIITTKIKKTVTTYVYRKEKRKALSIEEAAPKADPRLWRAFESLGYTIQVDPAYAFSGSFSASKRTLRLKRADDTVYHELGHFLAFLSGRVDETDAFQRVYEKEQHRYKGYDRKYILQNSREYFAQSYQEYALNRNRLKRERPQTYRAIQKALLQVTQERIRLLQSFYQMFGANVQAKT